MEKAKKNMTKEEFNRLEVGDKISRHPLCDSLTCPRCQGNDLIRTITEKYLFPVDGYETESQCCGKIRLIFASSNWEKINDEAVLCHFSIEGDLLT